MKQHNLTEQIAADKYHRTDNPLRGGLTKYEYADPRLDQPTTITQKQSSQGTGAPLVTQLRYDNRGNTLYEKSGELASHETQYDELSFPNLIPTGKILLVADFFGGTTSSILAQSMRYVAFSRIRDKEIKFLEANIP